MGHRDWVEPSAGRAMSALLRSLPKVSRCRRREEPKTEVTGRTYFNPASTVPRLEAGRQLARLGSSRREKGSIDAFANG